MSVVALPEEPNQNTSFLIRHRPKIGLALFLALLPCLLFVQHSWPEETFIDFSLDLVGYTLMVVGALGRLWATLYIGGRKNKALQRTGPYSIVRHPLYVSSFLLGLGMSMLSENPIVLALVMLYFALQYRTSILYEEAVLTKKFGQEYLEYARTTPCFLPKLSNLDTTAPETINLKPLKSEVGHALAALAIIPLFELLALLHERGVLPYISFP
ncbi:MAG: isoprenylcysteine carboxylmethyltransferase family protein [Armatimonadota bacterium]|nr:isoprenylcysteine carboxylmethyltransferase family protein [Armatimonadota bacterium]